MNKLIRCITSVNKDIGNGIVHGVKSLAYVTKSIFTIKFWEECSGGVILAVGGVAVIASIIGSLLLGVQVANTYFHGSPTAMTWIPIGFIWLTFFAVLYTHALRIKCKTLDN